MKRLFSLFAVAITLACMAGSAQADDTILLYDSTTQSGNPPSYFHSIDPGSAHLLDDGAFPVLLAPVRLKTADFGYYVYGDDPDPITAKVEFWGKLMAEDTPTNAISLGGFVVDLGRPENGEYRTGPIDLANLPAGSLLIPVDSWAVSVTFRSTKTGELSKNATMLFAGGPVNVGSNSDIFWGDQDQDGVFADPIEAYTFGGGDYQAQFLLQLYGKQVEVVGTVQGKVALSCIDLTQPEVTFHFRAKEGRPSFTRQVHLEADGSYSIPNVPVALYDLAISAPKWLQRVIRLDIRFVDVVTINTELWAGDATLDNSINIFDLAALAEAFNTDSTSPQWNADADFNCDGSVDIFDLAILAEHFNTDGDP